MLFFLYQANLHDTESAHAMRGKRVYVVILIEIGLAVWLLYKFLISVVFSAARSVAISFSRSCFTRFNLAVTRNQRRTIAYGEDLLNKLVIKCLNSQVTPKSCNKPIQCLHGGLNLVYTGATFSIEA